MHFQTLLLSLLMCCSLLGCDDSPVQSPDAAANPPDASPPSTLPPIAHTFPDFEIDAGEESSRFCQSWTLDNDEAIFVQRVVAENAGAFHHSNWFFVPDDRYDGPDGTWRCSSREFDSLAAGASASGGVLFAQSTQALSEEQSFPEGTALRLPARVRIVGQVHLLNVSPEAMTTQISLTLHQLPEAEVHTRLAAMSFVNSSLAIPPRSQSNFVMDCDLAAGTADRYWSGNLYYFLPHYHAYGRTMRLEYVGGSRDGEILFETSALVGEPLGQSVSPPLSMDGAEKIRFTCGYDNPTDRTIVEGIGDEEMCMFLAFTDSRYRVGAYGMRILDENTEGSMHEAQTDCIVAALPVNR